MHARSDVEPNRAEWRRGRLRRQLRRSYAHFSCNERRGNTTPLPTLHCSPKQTIAAAMPPPARNASLGTPGTLVCAHLSFLAALAAGLAACEPLHLVHRRPEDCLGGWRALGGRKGRRSARSARPRRHCREAATERRARHPCNAGGALAQRFRRADGGVTTNRDLMWRPAARVARARATVHCSPRKPFSCRARPRGGQHS